MKLRTWCIRIGQILTKTVLLFTGFFVFLTLFCPGISKAENNRGGITIRQENVPIEKVFQTIEKQSGYRFFYNETLLQGAGKVTLNLQNASLQEALEACFRSYFFPFPRCKNLFCLDFQCVLIPGNGSS